MVTLFFEQQKIFAGCGACYYQAYLEGSKGTAVNRSCSCTLIFAHEAIWEDLVYHFEIVCK
jgi:hypothetical protein